MIYEKNPYYVFRDIENLRKSLKKDSRVLEVTDFGTGKSGAKNLKDIARYSLKEPKFAQLLFRMARFAKAETLLELGTSLGITTSYLAAANPNSRCITMEGCSEIAQIAQENFDVLQLKNVDVVVGDINENLSTVLGSLDKIDFLFLDANHRSDAVLSYFAQCLSKIHDTTILIVDDIYWSKDMAYAWNEIKNHELVTATIDLYQLGIVFFNPTLHKKNYRMLF